MRSSSSPRWGRCGRRGASAVEFALILPVLFTMVMGLVDYGWFFALQSQSMSALAGALQAGAHVSPLPEDDPGRCTPCVEAASAHAAMALGNLGHDVVPADVTPRIERVAGTCALTLTVTLDHDSIVGLVPVPTRYDISVNALLLHLDDC